MSSRAVRRLIQQAKEKADDIQQFQEPKEPSSFTRSKSSSPTPIKGNTFSSFGCDLFSNDVHCVANEQSSDSSVSNDFVCPTEQLSGSKKKKKRKKKQPCKSQQRELSENDDSWLTELGSTSKYSNGDTKASECVSISSLLSTNCRELDHKAELNRLFVDPTFGTTATRTGRNSATRFTLKRGILVPVKFTWPPVVRLGLDMIKNSEGDTTTFQFSHSKVYQNKQALFYAAVASMDPDNITLSEILIQQDNTEMGIDLLGLFVALFRYINVIGNRSCYRTALEYSKLLLSLNTDEDPLAVLLMLDYYAICSHQFQFLIDLYESCRDTKNLNLLPNFAFSLPLARFLQHHQQQSTTSPGSVASNSAFALPAKQRGKTLKKRSQKDDQGTSVADTEDALIMFPGLLPRLLKHTNFGGGIRNLDRSALFGREVEREPANLGVLLDLYATRTCLLWSSPKVKPWFERNVEVVLGLVEPVQPPTLQASARVAVDPRLTSYSNKRSVFNRPLPRNILRHLLLLDLPEVRPHVPNETAPWQSFSFDPLPPNDSVNLYTPDLRSLSLGEQHQNVQDAGGILSAFLHSLLPGYATNRGGVWQHPPGAGPDQEQAGGRPQEAVIDRLVASLRRLLETARDPDPGEG